MEEKQVEVWIKQATEGDSQALELVLHEVSDLVFNLSLRMLGTIADAEDATQDILIKVMTHLSSFRYESKFTTWVYRIAVNYLTDYQKSMFAQHPLSFDIYENDIKAGFIESSQQYENKEDLAEELKLSCTNVMLQCFDAQTRCIYILGTMFKVNSNIAAEILDMTSENYRQKLSRARKKMAGFLQEYCGLVKGCCNCEKRIPFAQATHRLNPNHLEYSMLKKSEPSLVVEFKESMEAIDDVADVFGQLPSYTSNTKLKSFLMEMLNSNSIKIITKEIVK